MDLQIVSFFATYTIIRLVVAGVRLVVAGAGGRADNAPADLIMLWSEFLPLKLIFNFSYLLDHISCFVYLALNVISTWHYYLEVEIWQILNFGDKTSLLNFCL